MPAIARAGVGITLLGLGHIDEALEQLVLAADEPGGATTATLAALSRAFARVGASTEAIETLRDAVAVADPLSSLDTIQLARAAAACGLMSDAAELFARFLSLQERFDLAGRPAVDILRERPTDIERHARGELAAAVAFALASAPLPRPRS